VPLVLGGTKMPGNSISKPSDRSLVGLIALSAAIACYESPARAQQTLPTIDVGGGARRTETRAPAPRGAQSVRAPAAPATGPGGPAQAAFIPAGEQVWRGPTNVVGYLAGGTSTATKTNTPIRDIPQSITILTQQQLQDRNSLTLNQALQYVPGVTVAQGEGQRDQLTIRGQPTTADFYTDGVRDDAEYYRDLYNIQAVEVLKGPSALIFGRGGGGGVVNRVTKKADGETLRSMQVSTGSFGRKRVTFDVGQMLTDTLAFRVNGLFEQSYSYRDYFNMRRWGLNPTFTWKPFEKTFVTLSYEHYFDHRMMDRGIPSVNYNASPAVLAAQALGFAHLYPGYPAPAGRSTFFGNPDVNYAKTDVDRVALMLDHTTDFGLNIKNQTVYAHYAKFYQNTFANNAVTFGPGVPNGLNCAGAFPPCVQLSGYNNETPRQNIFNQTDLTYTLQMAPEIKHVLLAGMEFGNQRSDTNRNNARWLNPFTGGANINTFFGLPTTFLPVIFTNSNFRRHTDLDLAAGYVQDQISVTKYVDILAGVRFDSYRLKFVNNLINPTPTLDNYWGQTIVNNVGKWSPRVGLVFKPFEQLSLYGSYSRSFLPAAGDQFNTLSISQANLQPQGFENVEAGFKAEILPEVLFTGAIYNLNRSNQPVAINAFYNVLTNTRTAGGELGLVGQVTKEWQVSLGYGNQHAYVTSSDRVPIAGVGPLFTEKGKVVPSVPQNTFSFWNKYDVSTLLGFTPGFLGLGSGVIYNDKFYAALDNAVVIPGYARWDGAVYVRFSENISGQVNVENILGAYYFASAHNNNNIMPGAPRSAFVTVNAKF
jgi:catecholate siderophore receptor